MSNINIILSNVNIILSNINTNGPIILFIIKFNPNRFMNLLKSNYQNEKFINKDLLTFSYSLFKEAEEL